MSREGYGTRGDLPRWTPGAGAGGNWKQTPEDFLVEELPALPEGWPQVRSVGGGLIRDFPNISRVSTREYGHRVGIYRLLDARDGWNYMASPITLTEVAFL
jgi:hypothetical protein